MAAPATEIAVPGDPLLVKVRDGAHVRNKAAHIAVGVDMEAVKHVLGIWVQQTEGAGFWASVCAEHEQQPGQKLDPGSITTASSLGKWLRFLVILRS